MEIGSLMRIFLDGILEHQNAKEHLVTLQGETGPVKVASLQTNYNWLVVWNMLNFFHFIYEMSSQPH